VPDVVIGEPENVRPVVPPEAATDVTVADPAAPEPTRITVPPVVLVYSFASARLTANSPGCSEPAAGTELAVEDFLRIIVLAIGLPFRGYRAGY
jgi:hypothetical protein